MMRTVAVAVMIFGSIAGPASADSPLTGSELLRAERCVGDYVCDEDGSWQIATMCLKDRLALTAAIAAGNGTVAEKANRGGPSVGAVAQQSAKPASDR
jgi:hypothetical protein